MNDFKSRLICSVSHEIKTPLNCSISLLGIALDSEDIPSSFKESLLFPTYCNNYVLLSIINDILDFASIDLGKFKFSFH
jgi:K+-sensing histidine kinase KdpD